MEANADLTGLALVATVALLSGLLLTRLRQPALVGYIVAGAALGPSGLGLVYGDEGIRTLAELGVLMLLFIIGMELSLRAFKTVWKLALGCAALQVLLALGFAALVGWFAEWRGEQMLLVGFVIALSSTAVAIKILEEIGELRTQLGRVTVGVLIAQDLAVVPMLLIVDSLGSEGDVGWEIAAKIALAVGLLIALVAVLSRRERVRLPLGRYLRARQDIAPLAALAVCFVTATATGLIGLSSAYGAFLAGLVLGSSTERKAALHIVHPIQSVLMVVFFLSIGLLIDLRYVWEHLGLLLALLAVVTLVKTAMNIGILRALGQDWQTALLAGVIIGQIGEFSFVLAGAGLSRGVIPPETYRLAVALIALTLVISPLWLLTARRLDALAQAGITNVRQTMAAVYAGEIGILVAAARTLATPFRRVLRRPGTEPQPAPPTGSG